ncbi:MAG: CPBP family intramembrane metalloprotease [Actinomycetia bacterium]|nr:CPBP family intramembrane metalloprotease [Actinomycetes bacterium]
MRALLGRGLDAELPDPLAPPPGAAPWELAVLALVVGANLGQNRVFPDAWHLLTGPLLALGAVLLARRSGASWALLGLSSDRVGTGVRLGAAALGVVAAVVLAAALVPGLRDAFADDRVVDAATATVLYEALVRVPIATALTEEVLFRGVGHGLLARRFGAGRATLLGAVAFGCWHVLPTLASARGNAVTEQATGLALVGVVAGVVLATTVAGLLFTWLRRRSGSVVAPWLAHVGTNSVTLLVALSVAG